MTVYTISHKSAQMYMIGDDGHFVLFDCGWQDSFPAIKEALREHGLGFDQLHYVLVSHFHPDHAGSLELLRQHGVVPLVLTQQFPHITWINEFFAQEKNDPGRKYTPIDVSAILPVDCDEATRRLAEQGIVGQVLYTPGHSEDSITLIVGEAAFIGDQPPYEPTAGYDSEQTIASWSLIKNSGSKRIYPAHAQVFSID